MDDADDLDPIDIDDEDYPEPDVEGTEVEEFRPDFSLVAATGSDATCATPRDGQA